MVQARALPYYLNEILSKAKDGKNVLIASHGNTIRSLMQYIENIPIEKIGDIDMPFGAVVIYTVDENGKMVSKEERKVPSEVNA